MNPSTTAEAVPPPTPLVADQLADFNDRLSPMLVKELRQGLRARTFVSVFLALQILLALFLLAGAGAASPQTAGRFISQVIFVFFSLAVLVVQPLRGVGALHSEIKTNTLEMMVLTRLSAWRIVLGKWIALVSQSALLFVAIVPYLILRYWFGDMNLLGELVTLFLVLVASAAATAVTVGISAVPAVLIRGLLPLGGVILLTIAIFNIGFSGYGGLREMIDACSLQTTTSRIGVATFLAACAYLCWTALGISAAMIAPAAENHGSIRRIVTLGLLLASAGLLLVDRIDDGLVCLIVGVLVIPIVILSLSENFHLLPPVCRPFLQRGAAGRLVGRLLYPGWPSGILFSLLVLGIGLAICFGSEPRWIRDPEAATVLVSIASGLLFPAVVVGFVPKMRENRFVGYVLILAVMMILTFLFALLANTMPSSGRGFLWFFVWIPPINWMATELLRNSEDVLLVSAILFGGLYAQLLLLQAVRRMPEIAKAEAELAESAEPAVEEPA